MRDNMNRINLAIKQLSIRAAVYCIVVSAILVSCPFNAFAQPTPIETIEKFSGAILGHYYSGIGHLTFCARRFSAGQYYLNLWMKNNSGIANKVEANLFAALQKQTNAAYVQNVRNEIALLKSRILSESEWEANLLSQETCQLLWHHVQNRTQDLDGKYRFEIFVLLGQTAK